MKVVVTGGSGFLGSYVVEGLEAAGHDVLIMDLQPPKWTPEVAYRQVDVAAEGSAPIAELRPIPDAVVHMAGLLGTMETFGWPQRTVEVNTVGTINMLDACRDAGVRYVGVQTGAPWMSPYAISKRAATDFARAYHQAYGLPTTVLRVFNAYGPRQDGTHEINKIVPRFAVEALLGRPLPIFGDGHQEIDLIHAEDVAGCFVRALTMAPGEGEVIDVGSGVPRAVLDIARLIMDIAGGGTLEFHPPRLGEGKEFPVASREAASALLGFESKDRFDDVLLDRLRDTVNWYAEHALRDAAFLPVPEASLRGAARPRGVAYLRRALRTNNSRSRRSGAV